MGGEAWKDRERPSMECEEGWEGRGMAGRGGVKGEGGGGVIKKGLSEYACLPENVEHMQKNY